MPYNSGVPTPFNHLALAERLLASPKLPSGTRQQLQRARPAFVLGNVAPDLGTLTGLPREASHFFEVPMQDLRPAHQRLFEAHPELAEPARLAPDHAAFLAGYLAHLWLDQAWILAIFEPVFGPEVPRGSFKERLIAHNLLRAWLDEQDRRRLDGAVAAALREAEPQGWLPFAPDEDLRRWRDLLADQLAPGGDSQTAEVFAGRLGITAEEFRARLASPGWLEQAVFRHISRRRLRAFQRLALARSLELVTYYLAGRLAEAPHVSRPFRRKTAPLRSPRRQHARHRAL